MADSAATTTAAADDGSANAPPPMSKRARTTGDGDETNPSLEPPEKKPPGGAPPLPLPITAAHYKRIRFIGLAIPTTPANLVACGDPNGQGMVGGSYLGHEDFGTDMRARVAVLQAAAAAALKALRGERDGEGGQGEGEEDDVLTVFMAPEFFFHGDEGPYLHARGEPDPADAIIQALQAAFAGPEFRHWLVVAGSCITARVEDKRKLYHLNSTVTRNAVVAALAKQWRNSYGPLSEVILETLTSFIKQCHAYPLLEVRNRALVVSQAGLDGPGGRRWGAPAMTVDKYYASNEDLLLFDVNGKQVVTEQMITYAHIDLTAGDLKKDPRDRYAIFRLNHGSGAAPPLDAAVEICLDHRDVRLRRNLDHNPFPDRARECLHLQLIPSCGMQVKANGVAVDEGGWVFNVDGQYCLGGQSHHGRPEPQAGVLNGVACVYTNHASGTAEGYAAHTQLARVAARAVGNHAHARGSKDAAFEPDFLDPAAVRVVPVEAVKGLGALFAGGPGVLHVYGPLPL